MADKEIIIDGVNVSGCIHFLADSESYDSNIDEFVKGCCEAFASHMNGELMDYGICKNHPDCDYKKLSRKTAECEKYEQALDEIMKFINRSTCNICEGEDTQACLECNVKTIKDIISKAKDGNNEI